VQEYKNVSDGMEFGMYTQPEYSYKSKMFFVSISDVSSKHEINKRRRDQSYERNDYFEEKS
jgi:hypothetical protein